MQQRLRPVDGDIGSRLTPLRNPGPIVHIQLPPAEPSPADALKHLAKEIDSSIHFYEGFAGPFPFHQLAVSQIPGTFGQGWPGLLYLSTLSFLPSGAQEKAGLSTSSQEHFSELVPFHEVAHQWWGNVVGWSSYRDQWIDEALASYSALLFADSQKTPDRRIRVWLDRYRSRLEEKLPNSNLIAADIGAIPFDVEGVEISHEGERCSFDTMLKLFGLEGDPHLARVALIVRGADTARADLAPEAAGLHAISLGLSALAGDDDHGMIERGFMVYDALLAWSRHAAEKRHNWPAKAA